MRTIELMDFTAALLGRKRGIVETRIRELQDAGLIAKGERGRFGGVDMHPSDGINAMLGVAMEVGRGESIPANVRRWRALPLSMALYSPLQGGSPLDRATAAFQFTKGLSISPQDTLGATLDGLVHDMQAGAFNVWAAGCEVAVVLDFYSDRQALLTLDRPVANSGAVFQFGTAQPREAGAVEQITRVHKSAFERLATALA